MLEYPKIENSISSIVIKILNYRLKTLSTLYNRIYGTLKDRGGGGG